MEDLASQHKTLNINHTQNNQLYLSYLKHNNYTSVFASSMRDKLTSEEPDRSDLSLKKTNLHISLPYFITTPFYWDMKQDACLELVKTKTEFNRKLQTYQNFYKKDKKSWNWARIKTEKQQLVNLPSYIIDLVLYGDKNPYFEGTYDWFYTGGNLEVVDVDNIPLLTYFQGENLKLLNLNNDNVQPLDLNLQVPIYNIHGYNMNNETYLTIRHKGGFQLLKLDLVKRSTDVTSKMIYTQTTKEDDPPLTDLLLFDENKLITANVRYSVDIHDVAAEKVNFTRRFDFDSNLKGDLCQLESINNCLLFMGRETLSLLDFRASSAESERRAHFKEGYFHCDDLCTMCASQISDNYVYVASKHNVFKCDLREMKVVKKWAHMLDNSPIIIKSMSSGSDDEEYVLVGSFDETVCIHVSNYNHLPFKLPNLGATLDKYKVERDFVLREDVETRVKLSTSGLAFHNSDIFACNSIGDVFKYKVAATNLDDDDSLTNFGAYVKELPCKPRRLHTTYLKDHSSTRQDLLRRKPVASDSESYGAANPSLKKYLNPKKDLCHDMALIWGEQVAPIVPAEENDRENATERINTWVAETAAQEYDHIDDDMNE